MGASNLQNQAARWGTAGQRKPLALLYRGSDRMIRWHDTTRQTIHPFGGPGNIHLTKNSSMNAVWRTVHHHTSRVRAAVRLFRRRTDPDISVHSSRSSRTLAWRYDTRYCAGSAQLRSNPGSMSYKEHAGYTAPHPATWARSYRSYITRKNDLTAPKNLPKITKEKWDDMSELGGGIGRVKLKTWIEKYSLSQLQ